VELMAFSSTLFTVPLSCLSLPQLHPATLLR
jgi:hypothetical protein